MLKTIIEGIQLKKIHSLIVYVGHFSKVADVSDPQTVIPGQWNRQTVIMGKKPCNFVLGTENQSKSALHTTKLSMLYLPVMLHYALAIFTLQGNKTWNKTGTLMQPKLQALAGTCAGKYRQLMATDCGIWLGAKQNLGDLGKASGFT